MNPYALDVSGSYVFFSVASSPSEGLYRVDKAGGPLTARVAGDSVWLVDTLGSCVVYSTAVGINLVSKR